MTANPQPPTPEPKPKVALVHDWLYGGGAEKVVEQLHQLYPDAPIYTGSTTQEWQEKLNNQVVTGWPNWWLFRKLRKYMALPLGWWFRSLDLSEYDLVIISTGNGEAKQVKNTGSAKIICYTHTPVHFYWRHHQQYMEQPGFGAFNPIVRLGLRTLVRPLRKRDYKAAQNIDHWIANSTAIQGDIKLYYNKESTVIFPPVDIERFVPSTTKQDYFITVGRLVPYKRVDLIVEACEQLRLPLKIVGRGPELPNLKRIAGNNTQFITNADDETAAKLLAEAKAFLFSAYEDFGITPVEAIASGTPVIAYKEGGSKDYVTEATGATFSEQSVESLCSALQSFNSEDYSATELSSAAKEFDKRHFHSAINNYVAGIIDANSK